MKIKSSLEIIKAMAVSVKWQRAIEGTNQAIHKNLADVIETDKNEQKNLVKSRSTKFTSKKFNMD